MVTHSSQVSAELQRSQLAGHCRGGVGVGDRGAVGEWWGGGGGGVGGGAGVGHSAKAPSAAQGQLSGAHLQAAGGSAVGLWVQAGRQSASSRSGAAGAGAELTGVHLPVSGSGKKKMPHSMHVPELPAHCKQLSWSAHCGLGRRGGADEAPVCQSVSCRRTGGARWTGLAGLLGVHMQFSSSRGLTLQTGVDVLGEPQGSPPGRCRQSGPTHRCIWCRCR